jgi:hypothetical protein
VSSYEPVSESNLNKRVKVMSKMKNGPPIKYQGKLFWFETYSEKVKFMKKLQKELKRDD